MVLQRQRLSVVNYGKKLMKKTGDHSYRIQSNPIHGWIQSMSNSARDHRPRVDIARLDNVTPDQTVVS